jgi:hypothetical protein
VLFCCYLLLLYAGSFGALSVVAAGFATPSPRCWSGCWCCYMQPDVLCFLKLFGRLNLLKWAAGSSGCSVQSVGLLRPAWRAGFLLLVVAVFCCIAGWLSSRMIASQRRSLAVVCWHASSCGLCYRGCFHYGCTLFDLWPSRCCGPWCVLCSLILGHSASPLLMVGAAGCLYV